MDVYTGFRSKADAVKFAILNFIDLKTEKIDYAKAQELLDFINKNVNLPEITKSPMEEQLTPLVETLNEKIKELGNKKEPDLSGVYAIGAK